MIFNIGRADEIRQSSHSPRLWGYLDRNRLCFPAVFATRGLRQIRKDPFNQALQKGLRVVMHTGCLKAASEIVPPRWVPRQ